MDGGLMLERRFGLAEHGTDVRTEMIAGATTFLTMVYIAFVNPQILAEAGMDQGAVFVATCTAAIMPLTFSIATGIGFGFILYAAIKLLSGRWREIGPAVLVIALLFIVKFAIT